METANATEYADRIKRHHALYKRTRLGIDEDGIWRRDKYRQSGLWNVNHVDEGYTLALLTHVEATVAGMSADVGAGH